jgi:hypothetical protein
VVSPFHTRSHARVLVKHSTSNHSIPFRKALAPAAARPRVFLAPLLRFAPKRSWQCGFVRENPEGLQVFRTGARRSEARPHKR